MHVFMLVLCLAVSLPQTPNKRDRIPHNNRTQKESVAPQQSLGASNFVYEPSIERAQQQYDPYADRLYRAYLRATIIAAVFSLIVIGMLIWQNILTRQAANAAQSSADAATKSANHLADQLGTMRDTAKANRDSADALVNAERAWLMVYLNWQPGSVRTLSSQNGATAYLQFVCKNYGKTPAWIDEICCKFEIIPWFHERPDFTNMEPYNSVPEPVAAGGSSEIRKLEPVADGVFLEEGKVRTVYGVVKYWDMFGLKRETTFGYQITLKQELKRLAGRTYNENT
jgi:hypothetical protein